MTLIEQIRQQISLDTMNKQYEQLGYKPLFVAHKHAKILIVGQAPGIKAQMKMIPFKDASGDRLISWLGVTEEVFRDPEIFSFLPMDFYYPGKGKSGDCPPRKEFAQKWHPQLIKHMPQLELIILAGSYAQEHYLKTHRKKNLTETVKSYKEYLPHYFPLVHPSPLNFRWLKLNPWFKQEVIPKLKKVVKEIIN